MWHTFWHSIWHILWHSIWHSIWHIYLAFEVQRCALNSEGPRLRSSGAHWARQVPGWGPAVRTELGRSQVEVQRCALSSGAHWAPKLAKSLAKSWQGNSGRWSGGRGGRRGGGRGGGEGGGGRRRKRRRTTLIKSNNPHLAGGETSATTKYLYISIYI